MMMTWADVQIYMTSKGSAALRPVQLLTDADREFIVRWMDVFTAGATERAKKLEAALLHRHDCGDCSWVRGCKQYHELVTAAEIETCVHRWWTEDVTTYKMGMTFCWNCGTTYNWPELLVSTAGYDEVETKPKRPFARRWLDKLRQIKL